MSQDKDKEERPGGPDKPKPGGKKDDKGASPPPPRKGRPASPTPPIDDEVGDMLRKALEETGPVIPSPEDNLEKTGPMVPDPGDKPSRKDDLEKTGPMISSPGPFGDKDKDEEVTPRTPDLEKTTPMMLGMDDAGLGTFDPPTEPGAYKTPGDRQVVPSGATPKNKYAARKRRKTYESEHSSVERIKKASGGRSAAMGDINVTPMVDIVLVLLIIFMVITPLLQRGYDVTVPPKVPPGTKVDEKLLAEQVIVSVDENGNLYINKDEISPRSSFGPRLAEIVRTRRVKMVFFSCDEKANYGEAMEVVDTIRNSKGPDKLMDVGIILKPIPPGTLQETEGASS